MAKYYVQSGSFRSVVTADSVSKAAVWAVHQVMQQIVPTEDDLAPAVRDGDQATRPVMVLGGRVRVDERGFDRSDATEFKTIEVVARWNEMVLTLDRLQTMLHAR